MAFKYRLAVFLPLLLSFHLLVSEDISQQCIHGRRLLDLKFLSEDDKEDNTASTVEPSTNLKTSSSTTSKSQEMPTCRDRSGNSDISSFRRRSATMCHVFLFRSRGFQTHFRLSPIDSQRFFLVEPLQQNLPRINATDLSKNPYNNYNETEIENTTLGSVLDKNLKTQSQNSESSKDDSVQMKLLDSLKESDFLELCGDLMESDCSRWKECILSSTECCRSQLEAVCGSNGPLSANHSMCPSTWDGFSCWQNTHAGMQAVQKCPRFIKPTRLSATSVKMCTEDGSWMKMNTREWTNYSNCFDHSSHVMAAHIVISINVISIFFLLTAILVYFYFRDLIRQDRVVLHVNFFASLLLSSLSHLLWTCLVHLNKLTATNSADTAVHRNPVWCRIINFMCIYFGGTTYAWMFCEGFHLHRLISNAFVAPKSVAMLYCIGWGFPIITALFYASVRFFVDNEKCWIKQDGHYSWIIYVPNTICIALNVIFLLNILRILFFQLQNQPNEPNSFRRGLKAGLMLVPLFGVQMAATVYRPDLEGEAEVIIQALFDVLIHSQGIFVSMIFCFLSGEVLNQVRKELSNHCCKGVMSRSHLTSFSNTVNSIDGVNDYDETEKNRRSSKDKRNSKSIFRSFSIVKDSKEGFKSNNTIPLMQNSGGKEAVSGGHQLSAELLEMDHLDSKKNQMLLT